MKEISSTRVGLKKKNQADPILADDDNLLCEKDLLGGATSKSLLNILFSFNCKLLEWTNIAP